jgi:hypothetical protein
MQNCQIISQYAVGGVSFVGSVQRSADGTIGEVITLSAGVAGAVSSSGVASLPTGHGFTVSQVVNVHWLDPTTSAPKCSRGNTISTSDTNDIVFSGSPAPTGDSMPSVGTACVVCVQTTMAVAVTGNNIQQIAGVATGQSIMDFHSSGGSIVAFDMPANEAWSWSANQGINNPFSGATVASVIVSNGTTAPITLSIGILYAP